MMLKPNWRVFVAFLALGRAVAALGVSQQDDAATAAQQGRELLAAKPPALFVVGGDEADVVVALQPGVDDDDWNLLLHRGAHRPHERGVVERGEDDASDAAANGVLDLGDLRVPIIFT